MGILVLICITVILALLDMLVKYAVESSLDRKEERYVFKKRLILRRVYNKGFCMNRMDDKPEVVKYTSVYAAVIVTICQMFTLIQKKECLLKKLGLSLLSAGAWSNTFDRWFKGYVVDYIGIPSENKEVEKITFNLADVFIAVGGIFVAVSSVVQVIKEVFGKKS